MKILSSIVGLGLLDRVEAIEFRWIPSLKFLVPLLCDAPHLKWVNVTWVWKDAPDSTMSAISFLSRKCFEYDEKRGATEGPEPAPELLRYRRVLRAWDREGILDQFHWGVWKLVWPFSRPDCRWLPEEHCAKVVCAHDAYYAGRPPELYIR